MNCYLIDTNSLVTPYRSYYSFDFGYTFWNQLRDSILNQKIFFTRSVYDEIVEKSEDVLTVWLKNIDGLKIITESNNPNIMKNYQDIMQYIQESGLYKETALTKWASDSIADALLIATAIHLQYSIITFERPTGNLSPKQPSKNPKIPDVANHFGVKCISLFDFMREMKFKL